MKGNLCGVLLSGAALTIPMMLAAQPAHAQAVPPAPNTSQATIAPSDQALREIVVTANKREERLNRVGLTVTAIPSQVLTERRITTLSNVASVVPGLTFAQSSSNTPILTLRGVGFNSEALGSYPAVSVYTDQIPLPFPVLASHAAYDLERIEVLKGPQGTLFGENSTGGAINFIAAKPTSSFETGGDISYGRFNDVQGNAYLSGPIAENVRARIAGNFENSDGWQVSTSRPYDRNGKISYGAGRLIVDWDASDRVRFSLNANGWVDRSQPQAPQYIGLNPRAPTVQPQELASPFSPQNPRAADWSTGEYTPRSDRKFYQIGLRSDVDLTDSVTITALTSYDHFTQTQTQDADGLPILINGFHENGYIRSFNQEVRIANASSKRVRWVLGGNFENSRTFDYQLDNFADNSEAAFPAVNFIDTSFESVHQNIRNIAGFGNVEVDITPKLTAKGGVRYTDSRNAADLCTGDGGDGRLTALFAGIQAAFGLIPIPTSPTSCLAFDTATFTASTAPTHLVLHEHNVSWRGGLDYKLSGSTLLYLDVSRGYKAGSYPLFAASDISQYQPVTQESVTAYEGGIKTDLFDRRMHLNAAAFYYDYKNKQVLGKAIVPIFGAEPALVNVPKSRVFGLEADVAIRPVRGLTLTGSGTYLDTRIQRYVGYDSIGNVRDLSGSRLPFAPKFSYNFDAEYRLAMSSGGAPFAGVSVTGRSRQDTTIGGSSLTIPVSPITPLLPGVTHPFTTNAYATLDLRLGYEAPGGKWRVMLFGKNVLNKYYWNNVVDSNEAIPRYAGLPATYGVTLGFRFK